MRARNLFMAVMFLMGVGFAPSPAGALELDLGDVFGQMVQENPPVVTPPVAVPDVDINVERTERVVWYTDPLVIGAAVLALIVIVALVARGGGGGTTIVRD